MKTFWIRTLSAAVYAALFIFCIYAGRVFNNEVAGRLVFAAFLCIVSAGCTFELFRMLEKKDIHPQRWLGYLLAIGVTFLISDIDCELFTKPDKYYMLVGTGIIVFIVFVLAFLSIILQLWRKTSNPIADIACTFLPVLYIGIPLGLMGIINLNEGLMLMLLVMVWVNDSFAYMGGSLIGKHKLWQRHSPGKTWEGSACGLLFTFIVAWLVGPLFVKMFTSVDWLCLSLICSVVGTLGDLAESMMKRSVGVKDSGNIMPGHGGFLDRFDSLLAISPFTMLFLLVWSLVN